MEVDSHAVKPNYTRPYDRVRGLSIPKLVLNVRETLRKHRLCFFDLSGHTNYSYDSPILRIPLLPQVAGIIDGALIGIEFLRLYQHTTVRKFLAEHLESVKEIMPTESVGARIDSK